jgi:hypothetical protein
MTSSVSTDDRYVRYVNHGEGEVPLTPPGRYAFIPVVVKTLYLLSTLIDEFDCKAIRLSNKLLRSQIPSEVLDTHAVLVAKATIGAERHLFFLDGKNVLWHITFDLSTQVGRWYKSTSENKVPINDFYDILVKNEDVNDLGIDPHPIGNVLLHCWVALLDFNKEQGRSNDAEAIIYRQYDNYVAASQQLEALH